VMRTMLIAAIGLAVGSVSVQAADLPSRDAPPAPPVESVFVNPGKFDAFVSLGGGYTWGNLGNTFGFASSAKSNGSILQGRGSFAVPIFAQYGFQLDAQLERDQFSGAQALLGAGKLTKNTADIAAHIYWRNPDRGLVGALAQASITETTLGLLSDRRYFIGLEAQYYIGKLTLYGQAAYQNFNFGVPIGSTTGIDGNGFNLVGQARYFWKPNTMLALKTAYEHVSTSNLGAGIIPEIKHSAWMMGGRIEHRLNNSAFSFYLDGEHRSGRFTAFGLALSEKDTRATVGIKYNFGTKTLFERDRSGASLDPIRPLRAIIPILNGPTVN
jgi:hypothetical protein